MKTRRRSLAYTVGRAVALVAGCEFVQYGGVMRVAMTVPTHHKCSMFFNMAFCAAYGRVFCVALLQRLVSFQVTTRACL